MVDLRDRTYCKRHPQTVSYLGCSRCGDLICGECMIQTPVGARCPDHGAEMRNPMTQASGAEMTRALVAGIGSSILLHLVFIAMLNALGRVGLFLAFVAPLAIGYIVGEAVYRASGYTRNKNLAWAAAGSVFLGLVIVSALFDVRSVSTFGILIGMYLAYKRVSR